MTSRDQQARFQFVEPLQLFPDGTFDKLKSRLVAGGHKQDISLYDIVSSPTVNEPHYCLCDPGGHCHVCNIWRTSSLRNRYQGCISEREAQVRERLYEITSLSCHALGLSDHQDNIIVIEACTGGYSSMISISFLLCFDLDGFESVSCSINLRTGGLVGIICRVATTICWIVMSTIRPATRTSRAFALSSVIGLRLGLLLFPVVDYPY